MRRVPPTRPALTWVVLTIGNRPTELAAAVASAVAAGEPTDPAVLVVANGCRLPGLADGDDRVEVVELPENRGVPGGRDVGARAATADVIGFLDDDAVLPAGAAAQILAAFADPTVGAVALRLVDEHGATARRHVPRRGDVGAAEGGDVAVFLGGACAIRAEAYRSVGGYFTDLHYGHEELELAWRLLDAGWSIRYLPGVRVFHPRSEVSRHARGWELTGRNRVWIARRTLPWPIALIHVSTWLAVGVLRAPPGCRRSYLRGWASGWRGRIEHRPIRWSTVWRLARLGRVPII